MRLAALALVALGLVASASILEGAFERADHRKAIALVRGYRIRALPLEPYLEGRHADRTGPARWSAAVLSSCRGFVRVTGEIPLPRGAARYVFDVDLPRGGLHPADERGRALLRAFERASAPPADPPARAANAR